MRPLVILVSVLASLAIGRRDSLACSCAEYVNDPVEAMRSSPLVLSARAISITRVENLGVFDGHAMPLVRFEVLREWKGEGREEYDVFAWYAWPIDGKGDPTAMFDCLERVEVGKAYLFFARAVTTERGGYMINLCLPGMPRERASRLEAQLDAAVHHLR